MSALGPRPLAIRWRRPADDDFIAHLAEEVFSEFSDRARASTLAMAHRHEALVAWRGAERVGFAVFAEHAGCGELLAIAVVEHERQRGIGQRLLSAVERVLGTRGARSLRLHTAEVNLAALDAFRRRQFQIERRIPRYYRNVFGAFLMTKSLSRGASASGSGAARE